MGRFDELLGIGPIDARQADHQVGGDAEAPGRAGSDTDRRSNRDVRRYVQLELLSRDLKRADEACGIARCEQLFGIGATLRYPSTINSVSRSTRLRWR